MAVRGSRFGSSFWMGVIAVGLVVVCAVFQGVFSAGKPPAVEVVPGMSAIGKQTPFRIEASESRRGLTYVRAELIQGDNSATLVDKQYAASSQFWPWGSRTASDNVIFTAGRQNLPKLAEGNAIVRVTVGRAGTWLLHPGPEVREIGMPVRITPPSLQVTSLHTYVSQGGCELVRYRIGPTARRDGVRAGSWWFPGYPVPGGSESDRFALFSVPYDMAVPDVWLTAEDDAGNEVRVSFIDKFFAKPFRSDSLSISDSFIAKVVPEILAQSPEITDRGNPLENYLAINRELRLKNAETITALAGKSRKEFLWKKPFLRLPNGKPMAAFGDRRTYRYQGKVIDTQTHLGADLASTQQAPIPSPNDGVVAYAGYLGIYGNTVVIDHGYGLMSISGHLSSIAVHEGQQVSRGDIIGNTGATGLAGGDHLHFCILLQGLPVNPVEWWDGHWIKDRIAGKLGAAFPFSE